MSYNKLLSVDDIRYTPFGAFDWWIGPSLYISLINLSNSYRRCLNSLTSPSFVYSSFSSNSFRLSASFFPNYNFDISSLFEFIISSYFYTIYSNSLFFLDCSLIRDRFSICCCSNDVCEGCMFCGCGCIRVDPWEVTGRGIFAVVLVAITLWMEVLWTGERSFLERELDLLSWCSLINRELLCSSYWSLMCMAMFLSLF